MSPATPAELPLAAASRRLRRPPGRPRQVLAARPTGLPVQGSGSAAAPDAAIRVDFVTTLLPRGLSMGQAAGYLGVSRREVYRLAARGLLHFVRLPGCRRVLVDRLEVDRLLETCLAAAVSSS